MGWLSVDDVGVPIKCDNNGTESHRAFFKDDASPSLILSLSFPTSLVARFLSEVDEMLDCDDIDTTGI